MPFFEPHSHPAGCQTLAPIATAAERPLLSTRVTETTARLAVKIYRRAQSAAPRPGISPPIKDPGENVEKVSAGESDGPGDS
jgi:hypothetical protein